jgi:hypothetical protein
MKGAGAIIATAVVLLSIASTCSCFSSSAAFLPRAVSPLGSSMSTARMPAVRLAPATRAAAAARVGPRMAVGDLVELGNVQEIDQLPVGGVQSALKAALADGHKLIELEVPTTNRFKDQPLNVILQYNTRVCKASTPPAFLHCLWSDLGCIVAVHSGARAMLYPASRGVHRVPGQEGVRVCC